MRTKRILFFKTLIVLLMLIQPYGSKAQGLSDIELTDAVSGRVFSLKDHRSSKAVVLVFYSLSCPFSKLYEDRILDLHRQFSSQGFVFALVNPHAEQSAGESRANMVSKAQSKSYPMPYLLDVKQEMTGFLEVTKIPEVVVISTGPTGYAVAYKGAIDNNPQSPDSARMKYLENALNNILARKSPSPASTRAVGCNIRPL